MVPRRATIPLMLAALAALAASTALHAQLRVATYNIARLAGDAEALEAVMVALGEDDKPGFAVAPAAIVLQEVRAQDLPQVAAIVQAAAPRGVTYATATYTTSPAEDGSGGAAALLYRTDVLAEVVSGHADIPTGAGRNADRWHLRLVGYDAPEAALFVYGAHLKAGGTPADEAVRLAGVQLLRADAASLPGGVGVLFAGDMNFASSADDAYQALVAPGTAQAIDPLGNGSWSGVANAIKHTQSPRDTTAGDLIGGGMDDRFDVQLPTAELSDGDGVALMSGTYRSLGNDGLHFNQAINAGNNFYYPEDVPRSNALADALFDASDHVPVVAEYQVPAVMSAALQEDLGRVIVGATTGAELLVANIADVATPAGVDRLDFVAAGFGAVTGSGSGSVGALPELATLSLALDTSTVGFVEGGAVVEAQSEATQFAAWTLFTEGSVVRHANASFAADVDQDVLSMAWSVAAESGAVALEVPVFNLGFDADQALLDIDRVSGLGGRFGLAAALPAGIGGMAEPLVLAFDTKGAAPGTYSRTLVVTASDEDLPGATSATLIMLASVTVTASTDPADLDGNGVVDGGDLGLLLSSWGDCAGCSADLDGSGAVDGGDLGALLAAWSA